MGTEGKHVYAENLDLSNVTVNMESIARSVQSFHNNFLETEGGRKFIEQSCLLYAFKGFDVRKLAAVFSSDEDKMKDYVTFCCIFYTRGSQTQKIMSRLDTAGKEKFQALLLKYDVRTNTKDGNESLEIVTIPRIVCSLPTISIITLNLIGKSRSVCTENFYGTGLRLPVVLTSSIFLATIPRNLNQKNISRLIVCVSLACCEETKLINVSKRNSSTEDIFNDNFQYLNNSLMSTVKFEGLESHCCLKLSDVYDVKTDPNTNKTKVDLSSNVKKIADKLYKAFPNLNYSKIYSDFIDYTEST